MQSELKSLSRIFTESVFRIPDYQRGYSWEERHLKDFWSDLIQLSSGKSHYTGVLTLEPVQPPDYGKWSEDLWIIESKKYTPLYIVDGQQRLTTAIILLQCLLEKLPSDEDSLNYTTKSEIRKKFIFETRDKGRSRSYIFGYEKDNPSHEFLKTAIFNEKSEVHSLPETTIYTANLQFAKEYFSEKIRDFDTDQLEKMYTKLTQHLQFNIFFIEPELDVFVTFETMNNRGKPLSHLELLKNRLIYLSTKIDEDKIEQERLRRKINESWKTIYHYLGKKASRTLNDDVFLKIHFLSYFGPEFPKDTDEDNGSPDYQIRRFMRQDDYFKQHLLEEIFTVRRINGQAEGAPLTGSELDAYAEDIKHAVQIYYNICDPDANPSTFEEKEVLQRLSRFRRADTRLLCLVNVQSVPEVSRRVELLTTVERFTFVSQLKSFFFRELNLEQYAIKLKAGDLTAEAVGRDIDAATRLFTGSAEFLEAIRSIGKNDGFYGWAAIRYFLYEYEQYLRKRSKTSRQLIDWETLKVESFDLDHKSIEHIYPQRPNDIYWRERFTKKYSASERQILRNSLGNLLPASSPKNSSLGNRPFPEKRGSVDRQAGYAYGCLSEIQVAQQQEWDAVMIASRGLVLLSFMEERWGLIVGPDEKKLDYLGLGFVLNREGVNLAQVKARFLVPLSGPLVQASESKMEPSD
ncbi:DUF262 domain-containing protein [uncultured Pseudacidovorax sp.]|uniref:DUF262 domain-containing protein n=1 Tax=uncultured Pseudacidovorax sp. TaxID=679313 RepID=UPI0025E55E28|nr:DUF262 domain-containing protein [uncultured Pseudacidovorax sp.]